MRSVLSATKPVVPAPVATILVKHRQSSKGTCSSYYSLSSAGQSARLGKHICFHSDNEAVVYAILKRYTNHLVLNQLLQCLFFYAVYVKFDCSAVLLSGPVLLSEPAC